MSRIRPRYVKIALAFIALVALGFAIGPKLFPNPQTLPRFSPVVQRFEYMGDSRQQDAGTHLAELLAADYEPIGHQSTMIGGYRFEGTLWRTTDNGRAHNMRSAMLLMYEGNLVVMVGTWDGDVRCAVPLGYQWSDPAMASADYRSLNIYDMKTVFPIELTLTDGDRGSFIFTCDR